MLLANDVLSHSFVTLRRPAWNPTDGPEELYAKAKEPFPRGVLKLQHCLSSQDTFRRLFRHLDPTRLQAAFQRFMAGSCEECEDVVAIDGGLFRCSFDRAGGKSALVYAWGHEQPMVLGPSGSTRMTAAGPRPARQRSAPTATDCRSKPSGMMPASRVLWLYPEMPLPCTQHGYVCAMQPRQVPAVSDHRRQPRSDLDHVIRFTHCLCPPPVLGRHAVRTMQHRAD